MAGTQGKGRPRRPARTVSKEVSPDRAAAKGKLGGHHGEYWHGQPRCCRYRELKAPATDEEGLNGSISPPPVQTSRTEATGTVMAAASMRWIRLSSMTTFCLIWKIS